ncbi:restriction endonuclease, SacI family [Laspinema sp. A4]|uniref:restriction endonuclease, SacI family n=1 Tax=Laspinema sp. D2d TaxID=2953686 RepID=UPI0021BACB8D|nr:restriction endonuclease, SacI family [Laspinema sp. D2d]MCT7983371.1 restriction endonuclease, SacI family [Laspinema sp. D2d]
MIKETVNHQQAAQALELAWDSIEQKTIAPNLDEIAGRIKLIITSPGNIAFKYILITRILAKYVNPSIHPRALQVESELPGAYDARSLCHSVIVRFEKRKGNLFGLSNEPFLSKPARHREHDKLNRQLKNKRIAEVLHDVLEIIACSGQEVVFSSLVHTLRLAKERGATIVEVGFSADPNYDRLLQFVQEFLLEAEGGVRLVSITGAFLQLFNPEYEVKIYHPNASDKFGKTAGDIEIWNDKILISATECKHRSITVDDIRHGITKGKEYGIPEYCFTLASGLEVGQESEINDEIIGVKIWMSFSLISTKLCNFGLAFLIPSEDRFLGKQW